MFDHIGIRVKNLDAAARLYAAMLAPLGHVAGPSGDGYAGFGPKGRPSLWLHLSESSNNGCHVALGAESREAVERFYAEGLKAGARDNGRPGVRTDYAPTYYACLLYTSPSPRD